MESTLQYPIGQYKPMPFSELLKKRWLNDLSWLPAELENAILNLDEAQLHTPYREGGWTVHQLVHHVADSHTNAFIRFKLGLTEVKPLIKAYDQDAWAFLNDTATLPINVSLTLLFALHKKWVALLQNLTEAQWVRSIIHPANQQEMTLWYLLGMYVWHGKHHRQHILDLRERKGW